MKTKFLITVLAVLALAGGFAVRATREAAQTRAAMDALESQRTGLRAASASMEQRLRTASQALAKLEQKTRGSPGESGAGVGANAAAPRSDPAAKQAAPARRLSARSIIANDPQKMAEYFQNYRASLDLTHGGMFKALGFSAEQAEKYKDWRVLGYQRRMDLDAVVEMQGLDRNSAAYKKLQVTQRQPMSAELNLGNIWDPNNPYMEYLRTQSVRDLASELAGTAIYSGEPVTFDQVERTTQVLAANSQRGQLENIGRNYVLPNTVNWDTASADLQGVLSPSQIAILGKIIQRQTTQARVDDLTKRLTAEFKARLPSP